MGSHSFPKSMFDTCRCFRSSKRQIRSTENRVAEFVLEQDEWQREVLKSGLSKANPHREMVQWYLENWRASSVDEDLAHWGVPFAVYREEYVKEFAKIIPLKAGDLVFDSATGSGWLIKSLLDEIQEQGRFDLSSKVRWFGNDIIPDALRLARRDIPLGQFVLSDSANLTWIPTESFDVSICGYIEPSPDAIIASGFALNALHDWVGNWVAQMARIVKPGGYVCVGALQDELESYDRSEKIVDSWWEDMAKSDKYGWSVDPNLICIRQLTSKALKDEWGSRYCIQMIKKM